MPATAQAASLTVSGGVLRYTATPGRISNVTFTETDAGHRRRSPAAPATTTRSRRRGLPRRRAPVHVCRGHPRRARGRRHERSSDAGFIDGQASVIAVPLTIAGGDGNDALVGGAAQRQARRRPGRRRHRRLRRRRHAGRRRRQRHAAAQHGDGHGDRRRRRRHRLLRRGASRRPSRSTAWPTTARPGENDLIGTDVEGIEAAAEDASQTVRISGDGRANRLAVSFGRASIVGGEGADFLEGGPQDDTLSSRDGSPDTVVCNGGIDTVVADTLDTISPSCEIVQTQASPGGPFDDRPPNIAWSAPAAGVTLTANAATTLAVNATDDRGIARVQFLDDDRVVCDDTEAPYTCAYRPRGGDVGRNTLIAVAIDGANQTTSVVRPVSVRRFEARELTATLRPGRDRRAPYAFRVSGRLVRPEFVSPSQGCSGTVVVTAKRGSRTVSTKRATLSRTCEYQVDLPVPPRGRQAACASARSSAATTSWPTRRRGPAPLAWAERSPGLARRRPACDVTAMQIDGRNALVAGGASGLGAATARALHAAGANVTIADLNPDRGAALADELGAGFVAADVTDAEQVATAVAHAAGDDGLWISVCCAGIGSAEKIAGQQGPARVRELRERDPHQPARDLQRAAPRGDGDAGQRARRRRRARRVHQHGVDRGLRRADRPGRLLGVQGRDRRPHAAGGARPRPERDPRVHDRPGPVRHAAAGRAAGGGPRRRSAPRSRSPRAWGAPTSTPRSRSTSPPTRCSTARSSVWTGRCGWRPDNIISVDRAEIWYSLRHLPKVSCYRK